MEEYIQLVIVLAFLLKRAALVKDGCHYSDWLEGFSPMTVVNNYCIFQILKYLLVIIDLPILRINVKITENEYKT